MAFLELQLLFKESKYQNRMTVAFCTKMIQYNLRALASFVFAYYTANSRVLTF